MISRIQNFLQKHHKWFFSILLVVVIVAFVFTIGNMGAGGPVAERGPKRNFYGFDFSNPNVRTNLQQQTVLSLLLEGRFFPQMPEQMLEQQMKVRAVLLYFANSLQVPMPDQEAFAEFVQTRPMFQGPDGSFQPARLQQMVDLAQQRFNMTEAFVNETLSQDWRIEQVSDALSGPGYVLAWEAMNQARQQQSRWDIKVAFMDLEAFQPEIEITEEALEQYFELNKQNYELPPLWTVEYIVFPAEPHLDEVEAPTEQAIQRYYNENKRLFRDADTGEVPPLEEVREQVVTNIKQQQAARRAAFTADSFISTLFDEKIEKGSPMYSEKLEELDLEVRQLPQFSKADMPENSPIPPRTLGMAFQLTEKQWYSDAIPLEDGAVVLLYEDKEPARIPELEEVREEVVADYKEAQRREKFLQEGQTMAAALNTVVDNDGNFTETARELGLAVNSYEGFRLSDPPEGMNPRLTGVLPELREGEVSQMELFGDMAYFIYVVSKKTPDLKADSDEVKQARESFAINSRNMTASLILQNFVEAGDASVERQLEKAAREAEE